MVEPPVLGILLKKILDLPLFLMEILVPAVRVLELISEFEGS